MTGTANADVTTGDGAVDAAAGDGTGSRSTESRNVAVTRAIYEAVPKGDADTVFAHLDPEVRIRYYGNDRIPYAGDYTGTEGAADFFTRVGRSVRVVAMEPALFIEQGDHLAVFGHQVFERADTGERFATDFAHVITLRDGRWLDFRDFANSAVAADVFGRPATPA